jgi:glycosidase
MEYIFNPLNNKTPAGPSLVGCDVTYTVKVPINACDNLYACIIDDKDKTVKQIKMALYSNDDTHSVYKTTVNYKNAGLYWYYFALTQNEYTWYLCKTKNFDAEPRSDVGEHYAQVVGQKPVLQNKKFAGGVIYQVFVDRFRRAGQIAVKKGVTLRDDWGGEITKNSADFLILNKECFGGNLHGIVEKLPYIKSLGVNTVMLSPIFESSSYHKYDTADLENIDSMLGGNATLKYLCIEANKLGIGVLLDGVFNHVGSDSIYFNKYGTFESVGAYQSKKSKYLNWFTFTNYPEEYSAWWNFKTLPQFNEANPSLQKFIAGPGGVIEKHMKNGVIGYRLDVADELSDEYLNKICARIRTSKKDAVIMGEVWEDAAIKTAYDKRRSYFNGLQLNSVMNYPLKNGIIDFVLKGDAEGLAAVHYTTKDHYPQEVAYGLMNFLGTHDTKRILTIMREKSEKDAFALLKIASAIQYCWVGIPAVFYGDEAGAVGGEAPFCRVCYPWGKEDKSILAWYKKLGELRARKILAEGDCNILLAHNGVFIMERTLGKSRLVLAANCSGEDFKLNVVSKMINFESGKQVKDSVLLQPYTFIILTNN